MCAVQCMVSAREAASFFLFLQQLRVHFVELVPTLPGISNQCKTGTRGAEPSPKSLAAVFCSLNILPFALLRQRRLRTALCVGRKCEAIYIAKPQYEACFINHGARPAVPPLYAAE